MGPLDGPMSMMVMKIPRMQRAGPGPRRTGIAIIYRLIRFSEIALVSLTSLRRNPINRPMNPLSPTPAAAAVPGSRSVRAPETTFAFIVLLNLALVITSGAGVF